MAEKHGECFLDAYAIETPRGFKDRKFTLYVFSPEKTATGDSFLLKAPEMMEAVSADGNWREWMFL